VHASLDWWVGDAVAIACLTPFCLVLVVPVVRRFTGLPQNAADVESASAGKKVHEARGLRRAIESVCFGAAIMGSLWLALGPRSASNQNRFYVFFLPVVWIAVRRGLGGAATGILILNIGIVLSLQFSGGDPSRFALVAIADAGSFAYRTDTGHADQRARSHRKTVIARRRAHAAIA